MNKEIANVIPNCIEKIGEFTPARHREFRESMKIFLPFAIGWSTIYYIHKEIMTNKKYKHEEKMLEIEIEHEETMLQLTHTHEEIMEKIKAKLLSREEESKHEKDN